jgi:quinol monooxygenase YgiN
MAVRIIVTMDAVPGKRDALAAAFSAICPEVEEEPGCQQYEIHQSLAHPNRLVLLEKWDDEASLKVHQGRMNERRANGFNANDYRADRMVERFTD